MPAALVRVEKSSKLLEEASAMLSQDPYSGPARKRLIEGSGGILQVNTPHLLNLLLLITINNSRLHLRYCYASTNPKCVKSLKNVIAFWIIWPLRKL